MNDNDFVTFLMNHSNIVTLIMLQVLVFIDKKILKLICHFPYYIAVILLNKLQKNIFNYPK
jgi:hypothetical protein